MFEVLDYARTDTVLRSNILLTFGHSFPYRQLAESEF